MSAGSRRAVRNKHVAIPPNRLHVAGAGGIRFPPACAPATPERPCCGCRCRCRDLRASSISRSRERGRWGWRTKAGQKAELTAGDHHRRVVLQQGAGGEDPAGCRQKRMHSPPSTGVPAGMALRRRSTASIRAVSSRGGTVCQVVIGSLFEADDPIHPSARASSITTGRSSPASRSLRRASGHHRRAASGQGPPDLAAGIPDVPRIASHRRGCARHSPGRSGMPTIFLSSGSSSTTQIMVSLAMAISGWADGMQRFGVCPSR